MGLLCAKCPLHLFDWSSRCHLHETLRVFNVHRSKHMLTASYADKALSAHLFKLLSSHFFGKDYPPMICLLFPFMNHTKSDIVSGHLSVALASGSRVPGLNFSPATWWLYDWASYLTLGASILLFIKCRWRDSTSNYKSLLWKLNKVIFVKYWKKQYIDIQYINISCYF